jgi:outer membrane protein OmpA-like peptidoglycan-associated protein
MYAGLLRMHPIENYQSDAIERPLFRRRLFWALVVSLLLHLGIVFWFRQTRLPQFNTAPMERLVPRIFNVKNIVIDEKLLDGAEKQEPAPKKPDSQPVIKPVDLPDEKPLASVTQGIMTPSAPATVDVAKPLVNDKPVVQANEAQEIARVQDNAKLAMDQDLDSLRNSLLNDQPKNSNRPSIVLPSGGNTSRTDAEAMAAASGRLDRLLGRGLHSGDAPVTMPGGALFEFDSSDVRGAATDQLRLLGMLIKRNPKVTFSIEGYTDSFGDAAYNVQLSQARADAVRNWLIQNMDVDPSRITATGYGATNFLVAPKPVDMHSQDSIDQEKLLEQSNRRVEIRFKFPKAE